jgi:hypothetical protein
MSQEGENLKAWARGFWFGRGVVAAMSLVAFIPTIVDLSRWELLRAFHAIVFGWNKLCYLVGSLIGHLPFLPQLSATAVSTIAFTGAFIIPIFCSLWIMVFETKDRGTKYYLMGLSIVVSVGMPYEYYDLMSQGLKHAGLINLSSFVLVLSFFALGAVLMLPGYGKGLAFTIAFIFTVELLYVLNTPWIAEQIKHIPRELSIPSP